MSIEFQCPRCEATIRVPDSASGTTGNCPKCKARLRVPAVAGQPPARSPAGPSSSPAAPSATPRPPAPAIPPATFEFACPLCTAPVIVPVAAAGKNGKCPHCSGRIRVPHPAAFGSARVEQPASAPFFVPSAPEPTAAAPVGAVPDFLNFAAESGGPAVGTAASLHPTTAPSSGMAFEDDTTVVSTDERSPRRRTRRRNIWPILLPIAALALAVGGGLAYFVVRATSLEGEVTAEHVTGELPRIPIEKVYVDVSGLPQVQERLARQPLKIQSGKLAEMDIWAIDGKLWVSIVASPEASIFRVDPKQHPRLAKYADKQKRQFEAQRSEDLTRDGPAFIGELNRMMKESSAPSKSMQQYFRTIGLATMVSGLGYHVWAERGDECVYEDPEGRLYFVLPKGTTQFELTGNDGLSNGHQKFLGKFKAKVAGASAELPPVPPIPTPPPKGGKGKPGESAEDAGPSPEDTDPAREPPGMADTPGMKETPKKKKILLKD